MTRKLSLITLATFLAIALTLLVLLSSSSCRSKAGLQTLPADGQNRADLLLHRLCY